MISKPLIHKDLTSALACISFGSQPEVVGVILSKARDCFTKVSHLELAASATGPDVIYVCFGVILVSVLLVLCVKFLVA